MKKLLLRLFLMLLGLLTTAEVGVRYAYPDGGIPAAHLESTCHWWTAHESVG